MKKWKLIVYKNVNNKYKRLNIKNVNIRYEDKICLEELDGNYIYDYKS